MEKISIIIPIYNSIKSISRCIESVISQTYNNFELLLIDDGSQDNSYNICKKYAALDNRIKVYHQTNKGVSSARNYGLDKANGKWITFIDSDDWIDNNYLESLIINSKNYDCVISNCIIHTKNNTRPIIENDSCHQTEIEIGQMLSKYMFIIGFWAPWSKLFKRQIIEDNKIRYNIKYALGEDSLFFFEYLTKVKSIYVSGVPHYHYIDEGNGLSNKKMTFNQLNSILTDLLYICNLLEKKYHFELPKRKCDTIMYFLSRYNMSNLSYINLYNDIKSLAKTPYFIHIVNENKYIEKGKYRKFTDFCIKNKLFHIISVTYYITKRFY